ncbi:helix-turn-helix transcriptional regulator [Streptomyces ipomoeae]|uniref:HTH cro/C1-type domain-containing protein n=1 Tax=Streptomyces ipomoeae 91-03 TaxID=698759 RepID=L1KY11_9ACTN|nr:helix-turn-helix transcriptional regulator [Streptomyces ipomoeae]EKX65434.1 hypothetical protein STRIP9103_05514 [Streptomyces ipomoeae 91-03]MDX2694421.1 helix-turn-helix transcriptional regulator [Streptomyces ipomoeae]MDX2837907.1 helix-turn-helix transcriptional regulator [Streptomyces ipomoeae]
MRRFAEGTDGGPEVSETLTDLLRGWRERLDPRSVPGLVRSDRRRPNPGLSQKEVAKLTGVTDRWYRNLEAGHPADYSAGFLDRLAVTLRLSDSERRMLFLRVSGREPPLRESADSAAVKAFDTPMQRFLEHQLPHPAYISDISWNFVGYNQRMLEWFPWIPYQNNLMKWILIHPEARHQLVNWRDDWARPSIAQIRFVCGRYPDNRALQELARDVVAGSPEVRELWERHEVHTHSDGDVRKFRLPYHGAEETTVRIIMLAPLRSIESRFVVLMRIDD